MKVINSCICLVAVIFAFSSCKKKEDASGKRSEIESRYYRLQNIGWKSKTYNQYVGGINFTATEVPIQYYMLKDQGSEDLARIDSLYEANKTERIVEFSFQQDEEKDLLLKEFTGMTYEESVKYMSFALNKDFYVVTSKNDTIPCSGVNFERSFKVAPNQKVLLFFSGIGPNDTIQLVYNDYLFRKGTMKFKFNDTYTKIAL